MRVSSSKGGSIQRDIEASTESPAESCQNATMLSLLLDVPLVCVCNLLSTAKQLMQAHGLFGGSLSNLSLSLTFCSSPSLSPSLPRFLYLSVCVYPSLSLSQDKDSHQPPLPCLLRSEEARITTFLEVARPQQLFRGTVGQWACTNTL